MRDIKTLNLISKHLCNEETDAEKINFSNWLEEDPNHKLLYDRIENIWNESLKSEEKKTFLKKFTKQKIKNFIYNQIVGKFIGFAVGMSVTYSFSRLVTERRGINNLFGILKRKQIEVSIIPAWAQYLLSVIIGFIVFEFVNHIIESKTHILIFNQIKKRVLLLKNKSV